MAELEEVGITALGLEVIEHIDVECKSRLTVISDVEARLAEWTAPSSDGVLAYYERLVEFVRGKVNSADGLAEINAALHDSLLGIRVLLDGDTLHADIRLRPTGDDDLDAVAAELFGTLVPEPEMLELAAPGATLRGSTPRRSSRPSRRAPMMHASAGLAL